MISDLIKHVFRRFKLVKSRDLNVDYLMEIKKIASEKI